MNLEYNGKTYYQLQIEQGIAICKREIYLNKKDLEDRLRLIKKDIGKENLKEFFEKNIKIVEINEIEVINLGKNIK